MPSQPPVAPPPVAYRPLDVFAVTGFVLALSSLVFPAFLAYALPASVIGIIRTAAERSGRGLAVAGAAVSGFVVASSTAVVGLLLPFGVLAMIGDNPVADVAREIVDEARTGSGAPPVAAPAPDDPPAAPEAEAEAEAEAFDSTPRAVTLREVRIGHCLLELPPGDVVFDVEVVDCRVPHVYQVFGGFPAPVEQPADGSFPPYPGEGEVAALAHAACLDVLQALAKRRGIDPDGLGVLPLYPTDEGWAEFDTYVSCLAYDSSGEYLVGGPVLTPPRPLP